MDWIILLRGKKHAEDFVVATLKMVKKYYWKMIRK